MNSCKQVYIAFIYYKMLDIHTSTFFNYCTNYLTRIPVKANNVLKNAASNFSVTNFRDKILQICFWSDIESIIACKALRKSQYT